jgi:hypothetical protein
LSVTDVGRNEETYGAYAAGILKKSVRTEDREDNEEFLILDYLLFGGIFFSTEEFCKACF